jgi:hypothetical protein
MHCKENPIYVFPDKKWRGLTHPSMANRGNTECSPNFHIYVSVSDLYIPRIGPPIFLRQNRQTNHENIEIAHRHMNV